MQYMVTQDGGDSGINTILIVLLLLIVVGFGVWWFSVRGGSLPKGGADYNVDIKIPSAPSPTPAGPNPTLTP